MATETSQDVYKWDTEQISSAKTCIADAKGKLDDAIDKYVSTTGKIFSAWREGAGKEEFQSRIEKQQNDCKTTSDNMQSFADALQQVIEIYDQAESDVDGIMDAVDSSITEIQGISMG